jgi:hypothetical protein
VSNAQADPSRVDLHARHGSPQDPGSGEPRLPTFLIIGAPNTCTTSLHRYLAAHPEIIMAETKELNFFIEEFNWALGPSGTCITSPRVRRVGYRLSRAPPSNGSSPAARD